MKKILITLFLMIGFLYANDLLKQKNVLSVKNVIEKEEQIAYEVERYILNELKIPSLNDLLTNDYLGENFNLSSSVGNDISFKSSSDLQLNLSINEPSLENSYIKLLYVRELYRKNTVVSWDDGYISISLKSDEAKTLFNILKNGSSISKDCLTVVANNFCESSKLTLKWYNNDKSSWIEYNKSSFKNGDVAVSDSSLVDNKDPKLVELPIGTKIYIKDSGIKLKIDTDVFMDVDL